jgi:prolyl-tRNA synthetase
MSSIKLIGCSTHFLRERIEGQFTEEMSWTAAKSFHIDHIVPLGAFDLTSEEELLVACNWQNLRPVTPDANLRKGGKLTKSELTLLEKIGGKELKARVIERVRKRGGKVRLL